MIAERFKKGGDFEDEVLRFLLLADTTRYATNRGIEHRDPELAKALHYDEREGSRPIRHTPDGIWVSSDGVYLWEAKAGAHIERNAYEHYIAMQSIGYRILMFVSRGWLVYCAQIQNIRFECSKEHVKRYGDSGFPVVDGWIVPPRSGATYSGNPYKVIDLASMQEVKNFYKKLEGNNND